MNPLDELLTTTARVDDLAPAGLRDGRATLDAAIARTRDNQAQASAYQAEPLSLRGRRARRRRGPWLAAASTAAVAAVAAGTTVAVMSARPGVKPTVGEEPGTVQTKTSAPSAGNATGGGTELTAAAVLDAAGKAAGAQPGGWPNAAYWHVTEVYVRAGQTYHREVWTAHHGNGVLEDNGVGPGLINLGPASFEGLSWAQLYALPTDPVKLAAVLQESFTDGFPSASASPGAVTQSQELYVVVGDLLRESPASPALREALFEVAAGIPGVVAKGHYTAALGRTGTAVERSGETLVVDPANGALLADIDGDPNAPYTCTTLSAPSKGTICGSGGVEYTYVSQGPATSEP
jgi:hypothetical protein